MNDSGSPISRMNHLFLGVWRINLDAWTQYRWSGASFRHPFAEDDVFVPLPGLIESISIDILVYLCLSSGSASHFFRWIPYLPSEDDMIFHWKWFAELQIEWAKNRSDFAHLSSSFLSVQFARASAECLCQHFSSFPRLRRSQCYVCLMLRQSNADADSLGCAA